MRNRSGVYLGIAAVVLGTALGHLLTSVVLRDRVAVTPVVPPAQLAPPPPAPPTEVEITVVTPPPMVEGPRVFPPRIEWPPGPDSAALARVVLPVATPFVLHQPDLQARLRIDYAGHLALDRDGLRLMFSSPSMVTLHPEFDRVALETVSLGLAEPAPSGFRLVREGPPRGFDALQFWAGGYTLADLSGMQLLIGELSLWDLVGRWPVIIHRVLRQDEQTLESERFEIVSHGSFGDFQPLLTPKPWLNH